MKNLSRFKLLPAIVSLSIIGYFLTNFQVFSQSRFWFGLVEALVMLIMLLIGSVCLAAFLIRWVLKKSLGRFVYDAMISAAYIILFYSLINPALPHRLPEGSYIA